MRRTSQRDTGGARDNRSRRVLILTKIMIAFRFVFRFLDTFRRHITSARRIGRSRSCRRGFFNNTHRSIETFRAQMIRAIRIGLTGGIASGEPPVFLFFVLFCLLCAA